MLSHVEMGPAAGAGAGFKLFGKVITQPAIRNGDAVSDPQMLRQDHYSSERTSAPHQHHEQQPPPKQELQEEQERDDNSNSNSSSSNDRANGKNDNQSPASPQEAAETRASAAPLPCPRCRSRDTKFCYFNNYNVNQPRHFCKSCHRYWTAGGALRNVPVGAGRRKNRPVGPGSAATAAPAAGPRAAATAAGFVLGFPSSPSPSSLVYADRPAQLDRWFVRTEPPVGSDRRF